jgi:uncharacterized protein with HEPN domain
LTTSERDRHRLIGILDVIERIEASIRDITREAFLADPDKVDANALRLQAIGEMTIHLSDEFKAHNPSIPWSKIRAYRNVVSHNYAAIQAGLVWSICSNELGALKAMCIAHEGP